MNSNCKVTQHDVCSVDIEHHRSRREVRWSNKADTLVIQSLDDLLNSLSGVNMVTVTFLVVEILTPHSVPEPRPLITDTLHKPKTTNLQNVASMLYQACRQLLCCHLTWTLASAAISATCCVRQQTRLRDTLPRLRSCIDAPSPIHKQPKTRTRWLPPPSSRFQQAQQRARWLSYTVEEQPIYSGRTARSSYCYTKIS